MKTNVNQEPFDLIRNPEVSQVDRMTALLNIINEKQLRIPHLLATSTTRRVNPSNWTSQSSISSINRRATVLHLEDPNHTDRANLGVGRAISSTDESESYNIHKVLDQLTCDYNSFDNLEGTPAPSGRQIKEELMENPPAILLMALGLFDFIQEATTEIEKAED